MQFWIGHAKAENSGESIITRSAPSSPVFNTLEYFQPVFDQVDELNKRLDSIAEEENDKWREKEKDNNATLMFTNKHIQRII